MSVVVGIRRYLKYLQDAKIFLLTASSVACLIGLVMVVLHDPIAQATPQTVSSVPPPRPTHHTPQVASATTQTPTIPAPPPVTPPQKPKKIAIANTAPLSQSVASAPVIPPVVTPPSVPAPDPTPVPVLPPVIDPLPLPDPIPTPPPAPDPCLATTVDSPTALAALVSGTTALSIHAGCTSPAYAIVTTDSRVVSWAAATGGFTFSDGTTNDKPDAPVMVHLPFVGTYNAASLSYHITVKAGTAPGLYQYSFHITDALATSGGFDFVVDVTVL